MFNITFKILEVLEPQESSGCVDKFLKQDIIIDLSRISRLNDVNQTGFESKSSSILISLFGEKIRGCDFKTGDTGSIVGSHGQIGNAGQKRIEGIRFENPTYNVAYNLNGMKKLPENYGKTSFEFVLSELYRIKLDQKSIDLVEFFGEMNRKVESAIGCDETSRFRIISFFKNLPKMILASAADVDLYSYLLDNGLKVSTLNELNNEYGKFSLNDVTSEIRFVESVHYKFIGFSQLEIEYMRLKRKHIFFSRHEMRWFDIADPTYSLDWDFIAKFHKGFLPDSIEVELNNWVKNTSNG
jgi:hypothetical protein